MFVQVVTYSLEGISEEGYLDVANGVAPRYSGLPGLLAKVWLENPGGNRYGAVYFWEDAESMERFGRSDLFEGDTDEFTDLVSEEFKVLENLTAITQPVLEILEGRGRTAAAAARTPARSKATPAGPPARTKRTPPPPKKAGATTKGAAKTAKATKAPAGKAVKAPATAKAAKASATAKAATKA
ncbi:MAG: YdhR family protein, partial [Actinomycetota bacterium]|nr:YdhR family protein [Actinomycetota bacterium]